MFFVVLCLGAPEGSTGSVSGLKHLRRWGRGLKSHPTDWWSCTFFFCIHQNQVFSQPGPFNT